MEKLRFDILNENFDYYFSDNASKLNEEQIDDLPGFLKFKLFRSRNSFNENNTSKLTLLQKLYVLTKSCKKKWYIVIEDEDKGLSIEDFNVFKKSIKKRELTITDSERLQLSGDFVLGSKELMESLAHINYLSVSSAYKFAIKGKNLKSDFVEFKKNALYFTRLLMFYESNKKKMVIQKGFKMPEFYTLLYFYDGVKKKGADVYNTVFKNAYNSSKSQINTGLTRLHNKGYLTKYGSVRHTEYSITPLGVEAVNLILSKYVLDF